MQSADKAQLRRRFAAARAARAPSELADARARIRAHVVSRAAAEGWRAVAAYLPLRTEPGSTQLLAALRAGGVEVLVPVVLPDRDLDWTRWVEDRPDDAMAAAAGPTLGPDAIVGVDAALVPAFAVSPSGTRLGRGGGSYDRALRRVGPATLAAAVVFDDEIVAELPADPWDVPVGWALTPTGWTELLGNALVGQDG